MYYCSNTPRRLDLAATTALGAGNSHTCASTVSGTYCWGVNLQGAFGDGTTTNSNLPRRVSQRDGATSIEGGVYHTCSLTGTTLSCSGQNVAGEVGDGTATRQPTATPISAATASLSLGDYTSCAADAQGQLRCWGRNMHAQIDASAQNKLSPTDVTYVSDVRQVAVGRDHIAALTGDGRALCWGNNTYGQCGNGITATYSGVVQTSVANPVEIAVFRHHGCVRDANGGVWCFGEGYTPTPTQIALARPATSITAGAGHDCAITDDYQVYCWGQEDSGQLGNGVNANARVLEPQQAKICP
jgi:alpha-tubulin suppressor-like RCC1 family protein